MNAHDQLLIASAILGIGTVTFCVCLPLIYRKVPMNRFYGIRIPQSFVLVIGIYPVITTKTEFEELKSSIAISSSIPFGAIYVAGSFPHGRDAQGGYSVGK